MPTNPVTGRNMAPLSEIFGATKNTPRAVFDRSRAENAGTVANHRANDLAMACPKCAVQGEPKSRLFSRPDSGYYCLKGHRWLDWDELMSMDPQKLEFKGLTARQDGWEKLTIEMPGSVLKDLQSKFGEKLAATLRSVMDILTQVRYLIVPEEDIKRLQEHTGAELRNSSQLVGAVYSLKTTNANLEEANRLLKANRGGRPISPTAMAIEFGDMADTILQKAADWNQEPSEVVADVMRKHIENGWL
jgi:hypothetical protein